MASCPPKESFHLPPATMSRTPSVIDSPLSSTHSHGSASRDARPQWPAFFAQQKNLMFYRQEDPIPSTPPRPESLQHLPLTFLSIAVKKLSVALESYGDMFDQSITLDSAAQACRVLESSLLGVCPASPSELKQQKTTRESYNTTPLYWALDNSRLSYQSSVGSTTHELDALISPFLLLAGAEVLASQLEHVVAPLRGGVSPLASLTGLYRLIQLQLQRTKQVLCEPLVRRVSSLTLPLSPESNVSFGSETDEAKEAAILVAGIIDYLKEAINTRCQLLELQCLLFRRSNLTKSSKELTQAANATSVLLEAFLVSDIGPVTGFISNLVRELKAWKLCFESCSFLDRCNFAETLLSLRQWKDCLPNKSTDNRYVQWMHWSFQQVKSLLPVYFDRVRAFSAPLYGFDTTNLWQRRVPQWQEEGIPDFNSAIMEFLRRILRNSGATELAVALVLNAASTDSHRIERGYQMTQSHEAQKTGSQGTNEFCDENNKSSLDRWPAVFLRSSLRMGAPSTVQPSPHSSSVWSSQGSLRRSVGASSPPVVSKRKQSLVSATPLMTPQKGWNVTNQSILEYAPDSGDAHSFPHTTWEILGDLLESKSTRHVSGGARTRQEQPGVRSYYYESDSPKPPPNQRKNTSSLFSFGWGDPQREGHDSITPRSRQQNSYHIAAVGEWLRLVVIAEGRLDEPKRSGRRNTSNSEDVRSFLKATARGLSVRALISKEAVTGINLSPKEGSLKLPFEDLSFPENEYRAQLYANELKELFGIRPSSPFLNERAFYTPRRFGSPKTKNIHQPCTLTESAAALFLGPELAGAVEWIS